MSRVERIGDCELHLADCRDVLPALIGCAHGEGIACNRDAYGWGPCCATRLRMVRAGADPGAGAAGRSGRWGMSDIGAKVQHVLRARHTRDHECHWPGCGKQVKPAVWGCREHWYRLPKALRDRIWLTYRAGQENDLRPSAAYLAVAREVQQWIASQSGA